LAFPSQPPNWVDGQQALINGVTYVYSLANVSWSPLSSVNSVSISALSVTGNSSITGTATIGNSVVTGNEAVQGNETVTGNQIVSGNLLVGLAVSKTYGGIAQAVGDITAIGSLTTSAASLIAYDYNAVDASPTWASAVVRKFGPTYSGNLYAATNVAAAGWAEMMGINANGAAYGTNNASPVVIGTNSTERIRILSNGNIGIGTSTPSTKLHIDGSLYPLRISYSGGEPGIQIENTESSGRRYDIFVGATGTYGAGTTHRGKLFIYDRNSSIDRIVVDTSGNIGIGTTTPAAKLDVSGGIATKGVSITPSVYGGSAGDTTIGTYTIGNGKYWDTNSGAIYIHMVLPSRYNVVNSKMWCLEVKGYDFSRPGIINLMISGYVTPVSNGGPMSQVGVWDATSYYSPTAYYSYNYGAGIARFYIPNKYYVSFTVNSIASGNGDIISYNELQIIPSTSATI
jgi:hypothetical protein